MAKRRRLLGDDGDDDFGGSHVFAQLYKGGNAILTFHFPARTYGLSNCHSFIRAASSFVASREEGKRCTASNNPPGRYKTIRVAVSNPFTGKETKERRVGT